jgi:hypothetical protein
LGGMEVNARGEMRGGAEGNLGEHVGGRAKANNDGGGDGAVASEATRAVNT